MKLRPPDRILGAAFAAALALGLSACGGGGSEPVPQRPSSRLVVFGDSLSDVGTYKVSTIAALGGGQFTVNGSGVRNWTERLAQGLGLPQPCAAQTGLESTAPQIPKADVVAHPGCWSYAQGGARVREPVGPYNKALLAQGNPDGALGALTRPVAEQIGRHLVADGGSFRSGDLVAVWAGANDLFMHLAAVSAATETAQAAVVAMAAAGTDLGAQVRSTLLDRDARRVVVMTLPDVRLTPLGQGRDEAARQLIGQMVQAFNSALVGTLPPADERLLLVDIFARSQQQFASPQRFGIGSITQPACDLDRLQLEYQLRTSLVCHGGTLVAGDVSHHFYADDVHPAPYGQQLIADFVLEQVRARGWR